MAECWEFKAMLAQIARDLDSKDLEIIKYLCIGNVSKADLEDAGNSAVELWRLLQQRELIKPSDTAYLKRLLNGCRRDDLVTIVSNYEENQTTFTPTNQGPVIRNHSRVPLSPEIEDAFEYLATHLGRHWKTFARRLSLTESDIDFCIEKHPRDLKEQILCALNLWCTSQKTYDHLCTMCQALRASKLTLYAENLEKRMKRPAK